MVEELCNDNDLDDYKDAIDNIKDAWNGVKDSIQEAIRQIEIYLKKVGEASNVKVNTLAPSSGWNSNSGSNGPGNGPGTSTNTTDTKEDFWWSLGKNGSVIVGNKGATTAFANIPKDADTSSKVEWGKHYGDAEFRLDRLDMDMAGLAALIGMSQEEAVRTYRTPENLIANNKDKILQLVGNGKMGSYLGFATGGYTGDWTGGDGRLALLHSKELVLNEADTANFLSAVSMIRQIASFGTSIQDNIMSGINSFVNQFSGGVGSIKNGNNSSKQTIFNITAPITSTATTDEIQNAILQLPNLATQFASRNAF